MPDLMTVLQNTPRWVFVLFAALLFVGVRSLRSRSSPLWQVLATPAIFIVWGVYGVMLRSELATLYAWIWLAAVAVSGGFSWALTDLSGIEFEQRGSQIRQQGSTFPLVRNMVLFGAKYAVGLAIGYSLFARESLYVVDVAISGVSAGYFIGWVARLAERYRKTFSSLKVAR